jgi:uncharacterized membrane protein YoaK (UPF0700 family)
VTRSGGRGTLKPATLTGALMMLALGAGAVDALSFAGLGQVFTGVMTGNLVFLGLAAGQGHLAAATRAVIAIGAYIVGAFVAAYWLRGTRASDADPWPRRLSAALCAEALAQAAVLAGWLAGDSHPGAAARGALIALSAVAMSIQSTAVNALSVKGAATTYFTGTLTLLVAELATSGAPVTMRLRIGVITAAFAGAAADAALLTHARPAAPVIPLAATVIVIAVTWRRRRAGAARKQ